MLRVEKDTRPLTSEELYLLRLKEAIRAKEIREASERRGNPNLSPVKIYRVKTSGLPNRTIRIK
jgi:hypothetical protein